MDYINLVEGYIYCINQTSVTKAGFYFLMVLVFYALFSNTLAVRHHSFQNLMVLKLTIYLIYRLFCL